MCLGRYPLLAALFLQREGSIHCIVTGKHCFHLLHKHKSPKTAATTQRPHPLISTMNDFILPDFNLVIGWSIHQAAKFNFPPNFPAIPYLLPMVLHVQMWDCKHCKHCKHCAIFTAQVFSVFPLSISLPCTRGGGCLQVKQVLCLLLHQQLLLQKGKEKKTARD